ncbi:MAG: mandelate racemase/muconate lactonizing enzyme family protein, partial [Anaerolineae bacterium]|nr:mandelate racemase/muconate lactonizing enzyme family protein [Anaerolineae bacterium]
MLDLKVQFTEPIIISSIQACRYGNHYMVRVHSADNMVGIVTTNNRLAYLWTILDQLICPFFIGKDARELKNLVRDIYLYRSIYKLAGIALWNPVAYIELAILDLLGQYAGKSAGSLLGTVIREHIPVYLSSLRRDTTAEEEVDWLAQRLEETGASAVKLKVGGRMSQNADAHPGRTDRLIPLARQTFGEDIAIYVDANGSYDAKYAIEKGAFLQEYGIAFFEEPCPWQEYSETKRVADALDLPVAGGEQDSSLAQFQWMLHNRVVDIVQPDIMYNGGMIRNLQVAQWAAG